MIKANKQVQCSWDKLGKTRSRGTNTKKYNTKQADNNEKMQTNLTRNGGKKRIC